MHLLKKKNEFKNCTKTALSTYTIFHAFIIENDYLLPYLFFKEDHKCILVIVLFLKINNITVTDF